MALDSRLQMNRHGRAGGWSLVMLVKSERERTPNTGVVVDEYFLSWLAELDRSSLSLSYSILRSTYTVPGLARDALTKVYHYLANNPVLTTYTSCNSVSSSAR